MTDLMFISNSPLYAVQRLGLCTQYQLRKKAGSPYGRRKCQSENMEISPLGLTIEQGNINKKRVGANGETRTSRSLRPLAPEAS